ncbi:hypothetical protein F2Q69_00047868 [Brassica cretica]|uniref:Uncharacterized protein n=1 Tax=Brassica cretica TaxID=69181 RepID=A0A8S9PWX8_BRACR|nr:hypothetical protein F2Q69_00047868 [Brassica cretica]
MTDFPDLSSLLDKELGLLGAKPSVEPQTVPSEVNLDASSGAAIVGVSPDGEANLS